MLLEAQPTQGGLEGDALSDEWKAPGAKKPSLQLSFFVPRTGIEDMKTGDFNIFAHNHVKWRSSAFYVGFNRFFKASQKFNSNQGHSK